MNQINKLLFFFSFFFFLIAGENASLEKTVTVPPSPFDPLAEQTALVDGIQKFTEYRITVLCFTSPGDGPSSSPVIIKTTEDGNSFHRINRLKTVRNGWKFGWQWIRIVSSFGKILI